MSRLPEIKVQLIHMQGPLKGEIQSFVKTPIAIGRHPSCQVCFPADLAVVSRQHADIVREGNRFKIIDHSSNGTLVNGKPVTEFFLKDGDVITLTPKGPKFSFMAETTGNLLAAEQPAEHQSAEQENRHSMAPAPSPPQASPQRQQVPPQSKTKAPLTIQYGPSLLTADSLPLTIGRGTGCDLPIEHAGLTGPHVRIFYAGGEYLVEDATGSAVVRKNNLPIAAAEPLRANDILALSPQGPMLKYLGDGRFAEHHDPSLHPALAADSEPEEPSKATDTKQRSKNGVFDSVLKRLRRS